MRYAKRVGKSKEHMKRKGKRQGDVKIQSKSQRAPTAWISQNAMSLMQKTKFI